MVYNWLIDLKLDLKRQKNVFFKTWELKISRNILSLILIGGGILQAFSFNTYYYKNRTYYLYWDISVNSWFFLYFMVWLFFWKLSFYSERSAPPPLEITFPMHIFATKKKKLQINILSFSQFSFSCKYELFCKYSFCIMHVWV